jgi:hypothetical protein
MSMTELVKYFYGLLIGCDRFVQRVSFSQYPSEAFQRMTSKARVTNLMKNLNSLPESRGSFIQLANLSQGVSEVIERLSLTMPIADFATDL